MAKRGIAKEMITITNQKYEITSIAHGQYPFLHRIRALRDIGDKVKAGDLGGFVESDSNLSFEPGDDAWLFDNAIACGNAYVDKGSRMFGECIACDNAYLSHGASMSAQARAEDDAYIRGASLCGHARASGCSMILVAPNGLAPFLSEHCTVYGKVQGEVHIMGKTVVFSSEQICNDSADTLVIKDAVRSIIRDPARDRLAPRKEQPDKAPKRERGRER